MSFVLFRCVKTPQPRNHRAIGQFEIQKPGSGNGNVEIFILCRKRVAQCLRNASRILSRFFAIRQNAVRLKIPETLIGKV